MIRVKVVVRDPVRALDEDGSAVDDHGERRAELVRRGVDGDGAEADSSRIAVQRGALTRAPRAGEPDLEVVQRVRSVTGRPPQLGLGHGHHDNADARSHRDCHVRAVAGDVGREVEVDVVTEAGPLDFDVDPDAARAVFVDGDQWAHLPEAGRVPALEPHGLPDAGGLQVRSPIPSEATGHLAHHVERVAVDVLAATEFPLHFRCVLQS